MSLLINNEEELDNNNSLFATLVSTSDASKSGSFLKQKIDTLLIENEMLRQRVEILSSSSSSSSNDNSASSSVGGSSSSSAMVDNNNNNNDNYTITEYKAITKERDELLAENNALR